MTNPVYKYNEERSLAKVYDYINATYNQHYVGDGDVQTVDFWNSLGSLETTARDTAIKYLSRFGKKEGRNEKDLLKAIHYIVLMMYALESENQKPDPMVQHNVAPNAAPLVTNRMEEI
jgi:hypothetical protein